MKIRYLPFAALTLMALLVLAACNRQVDETQHLDKYACYESVISAAGDNSSNDFNNVEKMFRTYCGNEKFGNAEILTDTGGYKDQIKFTDENISYERLYNPDLRNAMEWLMNNTPKNAKVVAWWDYGGMIRVFADRTPVVISQSRGTIKYVGSLMRNQSEEFVTMAFPKLEDDQLMKKVALILTADDTAEAQGLMKELNAKYLFIPKGVEISKYPVIYDFAHGKFKSIEGEHASSWDAGETDTTSVTYKAYNNKSIPGFRIVYSDENAAIYEVE